MPLAPGSPLHGDIVLGVRPHDLKLGASGIAGHVQQAAERSDHGVDIAPEALSGEAREMLVQASQLAPHVASVALNAAIALLANGDHEEAERMLEPLASNPHDRRLAAIAGELLEQARSGSAAGVAVDPGETAGDGDPAEAGENPKD